MAVLAHCLKDNDNMMVSYLLITVLSTGQYNVGSAKLRMFGQVIDNSNFFSSGRSKELFSK